jgi:hypothetical protein
MVLQIQQHVQARSGAQSDPGDVEDQVVVEQRTQVVAKPWAVSKSISPASVTSTGAGWCECGRSARTPLPLTTRERAAAALRDRI